MSTIEKAVLMGHDQFDVSTCRDPAPVLAQLREANEHRAGRNEGGYVWLFQLGSDSVDYWTWSGHESPMRPGAEVPIDQVYAALDELIRTRQRPTCVDWVAA